MQGNFGACLAFTTGPSAFSPLGEEGGWADNPDDPGHATMRGLTLTTYRGWAAQVGLPEPSADDLRMINSGRLAVVLRQVIWQPAGCDALPTGVDLMVFDFSMTSAPRRSVEMLQARVGVLPDGIVGPITLDAIAAVSPLHLISNLADAQAAYYRSLPDFPEFGADWLARTERRRYAAVAMLQPAEPVS